MDIKEALSQLDHDDDSQWTTDGLPRVGKIVDLTGDATLTRAAITEADPLFVRVQDEGKDDGEKDPFDDDEVQVTDSEPVPEEIEKPSDEATLADLQEDLVDLEDQEKDLLKYIEDAKKHHMELRHKIDPIVTQIDRLTKTATTDMSDIRSYLDAQKTQRAERAGIRNKVLGMISTKDLDPRSPIDQALGQRGKQRGRPQQA